MPDVPVPFTSNYDDHSTQYGYQFEFHCMRCQNGYKSSYKKSVASMAGRAAQALGGLFGSGRLQEIGYQSDVLHDMSGSQAKDKALREAVAEISPLFIQCHNCGKWVCREICWNAEFNTCADCTPKLEGRMAQLQSQARLEQVEQKVATVDWTKDVDVEHKQKAQCPHCGAEAVASAKFCESCGQPLAATATCPKCGTESPAGTKFCPECGNNMTA